MKKYLDLTGLRCPLPVLRVKKEMKKIASGGVVEVITSDPGSVRDFQSYCQTTGEKLLSYREEGKIFRFVIQRTDQIN